MQCEYFAIYEMYSLTFGARSANVKTTSDLIVNIFSWDLKMRCHFCWPPVNPIQRIFTFSAQRIHVQFLVEVPVRLNQTILNWNITPWLQTTSSWKFIEAKIITIFNFSNCKWLYLVDAAQKKFLRAVNTSESARRI